MGSFMHDISHSHLFILDGGDSFFAETFAEISRMDVYGSQSDQKTSDFGQSLDADCQHTLLNSKTWKCDQKWKTSTFSLSGSFTDSSLTQCARNFEKVRICYLISFLTKLEHHLKGQFSNAYAENI